MFPLRRRNTDTIPAMLTPDEVILNNRQQTGVKVTDPSKLLPQQLAKLHVMQRYAQQQPQTPVQDYKGGGVAFPAGPPVTRFPAMRAAPRIPITPPQHLPKAPNLGAMLPIDFAHQRELSRGVGALPKPPVRGPAQYGGSPQYY